MKNMLNGKNRLESCVIVGIGMNCFEKQLNFPVTKISGWQII